MRDRYFVETLAARYEGPIFTLEDEDGAVQLVTPANMRRKKEADANKIADPEASGVRLRSTTIHQGIE